MEKESKKAYIVIAHYGYGDDYFCKPVRAFTNREDAEVCKDQHNRKADYTAGIYASYNKILDKWESENPSPDMSDSQAYDSWLARFTEQSEKLQAILALDKNANSIGISIYDAGHLHYTLSEVSLDFNPYTD